MTKSSEKRPNYCTTDMPESMTNWPYLPSARVYPTVNLVMQDHIEEGAVYVQFTVVLNKAELPKLIEKETDARARGADHFGQRFLTDLCNGRFRLFVFAEVGQE